MGLMKNVKECAACNNAGVSGLDLPPHEKPRTGDETSKDARAISDTVLLHLYLGTPKLAPRNRACHAPQVYTIRLELSS